MPSAACSMKGPLLLDIPTAPPPLGAPPNRWRWVALIALAVVAVTGGAFQGRLWSPSTARGVERPAVASGLQKSGVRLVPSQALPPAATSTFGNEFPRSSSSIAVSQPEQGNGWKWPTFWAGATAVPLVVTALAASRPLLARSAARDLPNGEPPQPSRLRAAVLALCALLACPAVALATAAAAPGASAPASAIGAGFAQAFSLIFFSEIGDKTFFIAGLLAVKYGKVVSYVGSMAALIAMSIIAVLLGQIFHSVPSSFLNGVPLDDYAAIILFAWFGIQAIQEALTMSTGGKMDEELEEAEDVVEDFGKKVSESKFWPLFLSTCSLVFAAEFGDKSFLATIGLSAAQNPVSVTLGAILGHGVATGIAVVSGAIISKYLSERIVCFISGGFFLTFAFTTLLGLLGVPVPF